MLTLGITVGTFIFLAIGISSCVVLSGVVRQATRKNAD